MLADEIAELLVAADAGDEGAERRARGPLPRRPIASIRATVIQSSRRLDGDVGRRSTLQPLTVSPRLVGPRARAPTPGGGARGTRGALPGPRRSSAAPRSGGRSRARRDGRGRAASRGAPRAGRPCAARRARASSAAVDVVGHLVHEADPECRRGVEALARHEVASRGALADLAERERRDHRRDDPELHLGEREHASRRARARCRCTRRARRRRRAHGRGRRDDGRRAAVDRLEHPPQRVRVGDVLRRVRSAAARIHSTSAPAQKLGSVAREDDRARGPDVDERLGELGDQRRVERVPALRPGEREAEDVAVALDPERTHARQPMAVAACAKRRFTVRARARAEDGDDVPRPVRSDGGVRPRAPAGEGHDPRPHVAHDARRLRRRRLRRRQPRA